MARRLLPLTPDPVMEVLKRDVDRSLLRANLRLSPYERLLQLQKALQDLDALRQTFSTDPRRA
ncbi:MAG TPA: hypothetical protein VFV98_05525 [Vicinamibacterales bacterium]|nr:hypothetical protein [Vicinamibacterales bacterium]